MSETTHVCNLDGEILRSICAMCGDAYRCCTECDTASCECAERREAR